MKRKNPSRAIRRVRKMLKTTRINDVSGWIYNQNMDALRAYCPHIARTYLIIPTGQIVDWHGRILSNEIIQEVD